MQALSTKNPYPSSIQFGAINSHRQTGHNDEFHGSNPSFPGLCAFSNILSRRNSPGRSFPVPWQSRP